MGSKEVNENKEMDEIPLGEIEDMNRQLQEAAVKEVLRRQKAKGRVMRKGERKHRVPSRREIVSYMMVLYSNMTHQLRANQATSEKLAVLEMSLRRGLILQGLTLVVALGLWSLKTWF